MVPVHASRCPTHETKGIRSFYTSKNFGVLILRF